MVGRGQVRRGERRFINAYFHAFCGESRFVDKAPSNSLRIPYLLDLFPDAYFVVVRRNPCNVINSMMEAWRHPWGYRSYWRPKDLAIGGFDSSQPCRFALSEG